MSTAYWNCLPSEESRRVEGFPTLRSTNGSTEIRHGIPSSSSVWEGEREDRGKDKCVKVVMDSSNTRKWEGIISGDDPTVVTSGYLTETASISEGRLFL